MNDFNEIKTAFIDTFINPVKGAIEYRAKNNFFGSLVISWVIWNWQKIAYFFYSEDSVITKINNLMSGDFLAHYVSWANWLNYIVKSSCYPPLIFATIFTIVHPGFTWLISILHRRVMKSIYDFNVSVEESRQSQKEKILNNALILESLKDVSKSETERKIAENNEKKERSEKNIAELRKEYAEREQEVKDMISKVEIMEGTLTQQKQTKSELTKELQNLITELHPYREDKKEIDKLHNEIKNQNNLIQQLNNSIGEQEHKLVIANKLVSSYKKDIQDIISNRSILLDKVNESHRYISDALKIINDMGIDDAAIQEYLNIAVKLTDLNDGTNFRVYTPQQ
ncbi:hypothetical protein [Klebsiella pneumoniae]|uniref:hypothetical protein n=1 Tax=Klebsiella pneumoniae TaxID=573 RepID=UPI001FAB5AD8|nr:hypothetical protein [Klebsiella pneumoniae]MCI8062766.1 hypothetical protein [Klebsiella pneumoniae]